MKICFVHNSYPTEVLSGAQRIVKNLAEYLASHNHEVTVITCSDAKTIQTKQDALVKIIYLPSNYARSVTWPLWRRLVSHLFGFFNVSAYLRMKQVMDKEKFDIVWTHNLIGFGLIVFKALKAKTKIHTVHDIQLLHPSGLLMYKHEQALNTPWAYCYRWLCRLVFPKNALVIFPSNWLEQLSKQYKLALNNKKLIMINPLREVKNIISHNEPAQFTFLYLGQIEKHKGVDMLIRAFAKLEEQNCKLILAGDGSLLNSLKINTDSRISFLGSVKNPEEIIRQATCVIVPSLCYENLPTAALEAIQEKVPVVGSCLGGLKELINDEQLLFEPNEEGIARVMKWCLDQTDELKKVAATAQQQIKLPKIDSYLSEVGKMINISF